MVVEVLEVAEPSAHDDGADRRAGARGRARPPSGGASERRRAVADVGLVGVAEVGDEVIVNVQALDLGLGSGGFDVVHANLSRGLSGGGRAARAGRRDEAQLHEPPARRGAGRTTRLLELPVGRPVGVLALHGQLAPLAWAFSRPGARAARSGTSRPRVGRFRVGTRAPSASCAAEGCWRATSPRAPPSAGRGRRSARRARCITAC